MLHENELINIEEDMILNPGYLMRRFTLNNTINGIKISIINFGATVSSIKLGSDKDEIIREVPTIDDKYEWQSHVLGLDTLLLTKNLCQSIKYQLTRDDELIFCGKFRNQQQLELLNPFFFNLNRNSPTIDGHLLQIRAVKDKAGSGLSVIGDMPFNLDGVEPCELKYCDENSAIYDATYVYSGESSETYISAYLKFADKMLVVNLRSNILGNANCRLRIRITKAGISLMPTNMTEFECVYKFYF